jgi:hypothetical protein
VLPSTAFAAPKLAFSVLDVVAVLFSAMFVVSQAAAFALGAAASESPEARADAASTAQARRLVIRDRGASRARLR